MKLLVYTLLVYFSLGASMPRGDFGQLAQMDELLEHYALHKTEAKANGQSIGFAHFLYLHYVLGDDHDHESEHEELPFQNISNNSIYIFQKISIKYCLSGFYKKTQTAFFCFYHRKIATSVFRPPSFFQSRN